MFAYCGNNPVMRIDLDGETWENVIFDGEKDPLDDPENFAGGGGSGNVSSVSSNVGNSGVGNGSSSGTNNISGGGKVTNTVNVDNITVTFKHGNRHLEGRSLNYQDVETIIAQNAVGRLSFGMRDGSCMINIDGYDLEYRYHFITPKWINIGTYFIIKQGG
jgi:hypothetical protein